jgi:hypothetical protein
VNLRQSALSVLRTFIASSWSPNLDDFTGQVLVSDANKPQIRAALLELATTVETPERKVKASASYAVSKIASADFPDDWPELLPNLLHVINEPATTDIALHGALKVLLDLVDTGFSDEQFFNVARDLVSSLFAVATSEARRPMLRALAVAVFRSCFDTLEMVLEQHKVAIKQFVDEVLSAWSPYFVETLKAPLPQPPSPEEANKVGEIPSQWRGIVGLKLQVVKVCIRNGGSVVVSGIEQWLTQHCLACTDCYEDPHGLPRTSNRPEPDFLLDRLDRTHQCYAHLPKLLY